MKIRKADERGHADHGWLDSHHTFSFADYRDARFMGHGALRVINEDRVQPGRGFGTHPHRDMEIVSYVISGELGHKDSMGNGSTIRPGDVQRMSAGTGVVHSEMNASATELVHFLQIWILPDRPGHAPGYEQKRFEDGDKRGRLCLVASPDGARGSVRLNQDARLYAALFDGDERAEYTFKPGRKGWLHVVRGALAVSGAELAAGDGAAFEGGERVELSAGQGAEILLFDVP